MLWNPLATLHCSHGRGKSQGRSHCRLSTDTNIWVGDELQAHRHIMVDPQSDIWLLTRWILWHAANNGILVDEKYYSHNSRKIFKTRWDQVSLTSLTQCNPNGERDQPAYKSSVSTWWLGERASLSHMWHYEEVQVLAEGWNSKDRCRISLYKISWNFCRSKSSTGESNDVTNLYILHFVNQFYDQMSLKT